MKQDTSLLLKLEHDQCFQSWLKFSNKILVFDLVGSKTQIMSFDCEIMGSIPSFLLIVKTISSFF